MSNHTVDCHYCGKDTRGLGGIRSCSSIEDAVKCLHLSDSDKNKLIKSHETPIRDDTNNISEELLNAMLLRSSRGGHVAAWREAISLVEEKMGAAFVNDEDDLARGLRSLVRLMKDKLRVYDGQREAADVTVNEIRKEI